MACVDLLSSLSLSFYFYGVRRNGIKCQRYPPTSDERLVEVQLLNCHMKIESKDSKNIAPQEIGAKPSVEIPPAELPGDDVAQDSQYIPDSQLTIGEKR